MLKFSSLQLKENTSASPRDLAAGDSCRQVRIMENMYDNVLQLIGNTPLVRINRLNTNLNVLMYAKIEARNPGGSIKDRIALQMVEEAERRGELTPGKTIIEATSGNTGIGLAVVAAVKGYKIILAMSETASQERQKILKALGAEIMLTPGALGTDGAIERVYELVREFPDRYYLPDQFNNEANWKAHYFGTGREIWEQTEGRVSHVVATLGTTGTAMGVARRLKEESRKVRIIAVEPYMGHKIQGLKNLKESYVPGIFDKQLLDEIVHIEDGEAFETARRLAREEGLFVGMSAGAAMAAALRLGRELEQGMIVVILPDGGERYLSTNLFTTLLEPDFRFCNTLFREKEDFKPISEGKVSIFVTGPPLHKFLDVGESRRFVLADLLGRYLEYKGFAVREVMNVSDLGQGEMREAAAGGGVSAEEYLSAFLQDLEALAVEPATGYPRTSEQIKGILDVCRTLVEKGYAYEKLRSVYFDISKFPDYGKISRVDLQKIRPGTSVDLEAYEKLNPRDFTLLRRATLAELKRGTYVKTPWGNVLPSWHLETVALAMEQLGGTADIHVSSLEVLFPHTENEIAIARAATGKPLANCYLHCERALVEEKTGEEEAGLSVRDLLGLGYTGREIRYTLLATHYRKPLSVARGRLDEARKSLQRLDEFLQRLHYGPWGEGSEEVNQLVFEVEQNFDRAMGDDINTSSALAAVFAFIRKLNPLISAASVSETQKDAILATMRRLDSVLRIMEFGEPVLDKESLGLVEARERARVERNWPEADRIRRALLERGVQVIDTPQGTRWKRVRD
jgi:cysteinyl-tRNA synthetase